jgi:hypothetical protein
MLPACTIGSMTALTGRPGTRVLAWSLASFVLLVIAGALVLLPFNARVMGMADRLAALGGTLDVSSAPGHGTRVTGRVPAALEATLSLSSPGGPSAPSGGWRGVTARRTEIPAWHGAGPEPGRPAAGPGNIRPPPAGHG